jgi:Na+-driven multidrug efflux pump
MAVRPCCAKAAAVNFAGKEIAIGLIIQYNKRRFYGKGVIFMTPKDSFWKKLTPLVFPIAFQQLMSALVSTSDTLMLGLIDQSSLSAVSLATQITFVVSLFMFGLTGAGSLL